jgi:hypothetical protein
MVRWPFSCGLAMAMVCGSLLLGCASGAISPTQIAPEVGSGQVRHARSTVMALVDFANAPSSLWAYRTSAREVWIAPDGSGRIEEFTTALDPVSPFDNADWSAAGSPDTGDMAENFASGGLWYLRPADAKIGIENLSTAAGPGEGLRALSSLLAETAPTPATVTAAIHAARDLPGVSIQTVGDRLSLVGRTADGNAEIELLFDTARSRLVSETHRSLRPLAGTDLRVPFLTFYRELILEENLGTWSPTGEPMPSH